MSLMYSIGSIDGEIVWVIRLKDRIIVVMRGFVASRPVSWSSHKVYFLRQIMPRLDGAWILDWEK